MSSTRKLRYSEIKDYRQVLQELQGGTDPITGLEITDGVLDHDHSSGHVRAVLQREVNAFEGRVLNSYNRYMRHLGLSINEALEGLMKYWSRDYSDQPLHPKHRTPRDKLLKLYRRRMKAAKRERTKDKYRRLIRELQD